MFWRMPVKTIGSILGASAFKKGDLVRTWDELGKWDYYVYEGCPDTDDKWLVGDKLGISTYIEAPFTDFQVTLDASTPNPYINISSEEKQASFIWGKQQQATAEYCGFTLPEKMNRFEAWSLLQTLPKSHKHVKYKSKLLSIRKKVQSGFSTSDSKILSYTEYVLLPKRIEGAPHGDNSLNWEWLTKITGITVKQDYDNLFQLCVLPRLWTKDKLNIINHEGKTVFTIVHNPRVHATLHVH